MDWVGAVAIAGLGWSHAQHQVAVDLQAARSQKIYRSPFEGSKNLFPRDLSRRVAGPRGGPTQTLFESKAGLAARCALATSAVAACTRFPPQDAVLLHPRCGASPIWSFFRTPSIRTKANPDVATCEWRCHFVGRSAAIPPHVLHPHDSGTPRGANYGNINRALSVPEERKPRTPPPRFVAGRGGLGVCVVLILGSFSNTGYRREMTGRSEP